MLPGMPPPRGHRPAEGRRRARETTGWRLCSGLEAVGGTASVTSGSDHAMARGEQRRPPAEETERELPRREWERGLRRGAGSAVSGSGRWGRGVVSGGGGACGAGRCDRRDLARVGVGTTGGSGAKRGRGGGRAIASMEGGGGRSWTHRATSVTVECSTVPTGVV
jgi:hypothetical protein